MNGVKEEVVELRRLLEEEKRKLFLEKKRGAWFEKKVNELQTVVGEWERKDVLQREKEYEERLKKERREKMMEEIRDRIEIEEKVREVQAGKKRKLCFSNV